MSKESIDSLLVKVEILPDSEKIEPLFQIGDFYETEGKYDKAMSYYNQALDLALSKGLRKESAKGKIKIGVINWCIGNFDKALDYYIKALKIYEEDNHLEGISNALSSIGVVYYRLQKYDKALEYYKKSLEGFNEIGSKEMISKSYSYIGNIYRHLKNYPEALKNYRNSLEISEKLNLKKNIGYTYTNIGRVYADLENYDKALDYFMQSLKVREEIDHKRGIAITLNYIGNIYIKKDKFEEAAVYIEKALAISKSIGTRTTIRDSYNLFSEVFLAKEDYKKAFEYYRLYSEFKDSIINEESSKKIAELQTRYETEAKIREAEIYRLKNVELVVANEIIQKKNKELMETHKKLEQLARTDPLTKLSNRRAFLERAEHEIHRFERNKKVFSILLGDIDHFKQFNDKYGHDCGDFVLVSIAKLIKSITRKPDISARWGGEEFIILLPETNKNNASIIAERIRENLYNSVFSFKEHELSVSITIGIAEYDSGTDLDTCIKLADEALYKGKESGRNCIVVHK